MPEAPYLIQFDQLGNPKEGYLVSTQFAAKIPFEVRRIFWTYAIPETSSRGQHANKLTKEVLVAISGSITVKTETAAGKQTFVLSSPEQGLYIPALCWTELTFKKGAIGLCLASTDFDDADYIRTYDQFKALLATGV